MALAPRRVAGALPKPIMPAYRRRFHAGRLPPIAHSPALTLDQLSSPRAVLSQIAELRPALASGRELSGSGAVDAREVISVDHFGPLPGPPGGIWSKTALCSLS
jgi:hypothetical protein